MLIHLHDTYANLYSGKADATETGWNTEPRMFIIWPWTKEDYYPLPNHHLILLVNSLFQSLCVFC